MKIRAGFFLCQSHIVHFFIVKILVSRNQTLKKTNSLWQTLIYAIWYQILKKPYQVRYLKNKTFLLLKRLNRINKSYSINHAYYFVLFLVVFFSFVLFYFYLFIYFFAIINIDCFLLLKVIWISPLYRISKKKNQLFIYVWD